MPELVNLPLTLRDTGLDILRQFRTELLPLDPLINLLLRLHCSLFRLQLHLFLIFLITAFIFL